MYVNTSEPSYTIEVLRLGWYDGRGSRSMMRAPWCARGSARASCKFYPGIGLVECDWRNPYVLKDPAKLGSHGLAERVSHVAKLTASASGKAKVYSFSWCATIRAPRIFWFQCSVNTYQAYNEWGSWSLYTNPRAHACVLSNWPYAGDYGLGDFLSYEFHMMRFLESQNYDVTYTTNVETHRQGELLRLHKAFCRSVTTNTWHPAVARPSRNGPQPPCKRWLLRVQCLLLADPV